ncbi:STAS domain-containing protein [Phycicoccus sp. BSK3Z-2]|uniref:STAS domain-containing protein n=1 Tax=Phycicoccus avicenniae TaxID=2828860 RepID=A0A941D7V0_9MICO|nr:STAS domain-containing protein [Phycicoccus avicenniae]MBR7743714.1 STAS domain-containing protein [Phycicoccus avicenniae]
MTTCRTGDALRVVVEGRLDASTVADIRIALHEVVAGADGGPVLVDLAGAEIGDATALGLLVEVRRHARRVGCVVHVVEACPRTLRLLRRARLHGLLVPPHPATPAPVVAG